MLPSTQDRIDAAKIIACEVTAGTLLLVLVWCGVAVVLVRWAWSVL